ncbi:hypothetical protein A2331_02130 [Candidatus Falkowbacteria bacterium RIFOXYB2_FULL_34_18]|uniref:Uncharacterized protein n=1 Tax=Candidatus Falkowbacteria bacterium RIFOXYD2_FULL_34_120 TaxID=1798007 RepID=A0A1F5TRR8_9BACT|nr:MAG: hypothetical protein A2331_02130 [Candidatus Falkowbacteria bacterium RIFOXYB2_FULL_34_18]OGF29533.1 MAG: hypothetical protein A2500_02400 [Candidatus Falkowbacteria bacterium RIFOXYC12_FULL_34_55]OGF36857.1 MAG: hypothetical protein A2466_06570 [Candidatus Falkowbacteria bacterium RIFOXYC2_FULL_34_220]OGF39056.1 MAG: hypothetical protein A2515_04575 [Candidatus Falkowbacteria bacterium RIFOXYD12_FULL_34_57]OGF41291.1 MAG: hypothetical protein A2531_00315 [Candidatus Falkowbacteria bact
MPDFSLIPINLYIGVFSLLLAVFFYVAAVKSEFLRWFGIAAGIGLSMCFISIVSVVGAYVPIIGFYLIWALHMMNLKGRLFAVKS